MKPIFFHQPGCGMCKAIEMQIKKYNIEVEDCQDIEKMKELGVTHTPAILVDGKILQGKEVFNWVNSHKK